MRPNRARAALTATLTLLGAAVGPGVPAKPGARPTTLPLAERTADEILKSYTFVGDFEPKEAEREISSELFWRYPYQLPHIDFPMRFQFDDPLLEMPKTVGDGRAVEHLNRGRIAFLDGDYLEAKGTWLSARARFGNKYPFHRRDDYFIGWSFLKIAEDIMVKKDVPFDNADVKNNIANAGTFLSWAFIVKADQPDAVVERNMPKGLYNLAAAYWHYDRFAGAFGAAESGLNFLRKTGRKEYRNDFHRILAESFIRSRDYLAAVQELDTAIRQDRDLRAAAAAFARVGDIYFDLNNYDLAEDAYGLGAKVDEDGGEVNPQQLALRGESLFWLGKFSEAQKVLHYALEGDGLYRKDKVRGKLSSETAAWASLRIADAFLARWGEVKDKNSKPAQDLRQQAVLEYYKVGHEYRNLAGRIAKMREACLALPFYKSPDNNITHARDLLEEIKAEADFPPMAKELAWSCQVASFTEREQTPAMLDRVKAFAAAYPESAFLRSFVEPVRDFQAARIEPYFQSGDIYRAISFFEKNRKNLFPKVPPSLETRLFAAYADIRKPEAAAEFWGAYAKVPDADLKVLRQVAVASAMAQRHAKGPWQERNVSLGKTLAKRAWSAPPDKLTISYLDRMIDCLSDDACAKLAGGHLPWMYALAKHFGSLDNTLVCDLEYPLLSRLNSKGDGPRQLAATRVTELIAQELPDLFRHDESCALSLLELEANRLKVEPQALAGVYLKRRDWPLVAGFLHLYWTISEHVYDAGERLLARQLWEVIRDKGPPDSPEVEFAKARLDPTRTEFEKLWD